MKLKDLKIGYQLAQQLDVRIKYYNVAWNLHISMYDWHFDFTVKLIPPITLMKYWLHQKALHTI